MVLKKNNELDLALRAFETEQKIIMYDKGKSIREDKEREIIDKEKEILELREMNEEYQKLINEQDEEIQILKENCEKLEKSEDLYLKQFKVKELSEFLMKSSEDIKETKHKLENLYFKVLEKLEKLENCPDEEAEKANYDENKNNKLLGSLKNYCEIIQKQIDDLEVLERNIDYPENLEDFLIQERNLTSDRLLTTEVLTISSDDEAR